MAMLEVLTEVVCTEELLALIAFTKLVDVVEMVHSYVPVRRIRKFLAAVPTCVCVGGVREASRVGRLLLCNRSMGCRGGGHIGVHGGVEGILEGLQGGA